MSIMRYARRMAQDRVDAGATEEALLGSSGYLLARVGGESRRLWARMLAGHGLAPGHFGVLMSLHRLGALSQQQLSRAAGLDPRNAVVILDALEERELLERQPDPRDRRRHAVRLTPAGTRLMAQLTKEGDRLEHAMLDCLSPHERAELHRLLLTVFRSIRDE